MLIRRPEAKRLKGLSGVFEIVADFNRKTYRAVYAVKIGDTIYVLHVFQKKSTQGIATPQREIDTIKSRYKQALADHKAGRKD